MHVGLKREVDQAGGADDRQHAGKDAEDQQADACAFGAQVRQRGAQGEGRPGGEQCLGGGEGPSQRWAAGCAVVVDPVVELLELVEHVEHEVGESCTRSGHVMWGCPTAGLVESADWNSGKRGLELWNTEVQE